jgi:hypothetical protein
VLHVGSGSMVGPQDARYLMADLLVRFGSIDVLRDFAFLSIRTWSVFFHPHRISHYISGGPSSLIE